MWRGQTEKHSTAMGAGVLTCLMCVVVALNAIAAVSLKWNNTKIMFMLWNVIYSPFFKINRYIHSKKWSLTTFFLYFLLQAAGLALFAVAIWVAVDGYKLYPISGVSGKDDIFAGAWIAIFTGFAFFLTCIFGIFAALKRSRALLLVVGFHRGQWQRQQYSYLTSILPLVRQSNLGLK